MVGGGLCGGGGYDGYDGGVGGGGGLSIEHWACAHSTDLEDTVSVPGDVAPRSRVVGVPDPPKSDVGVPCVEEPRVFHEGSHVDEQRRVDVVLPHLKRRSHDGRARARTVGSVCIGEWW